MPIPNYPNSQININVPAGPTASIGGVRQNFAWASQEIGLMQAAITARNPVGPTGAPGVAGSRGATGVTGQAGTNGATGATGLTGATGPTGGGGAGGGIVRAIVSPSAPPGPAYGTLWADIAGSPYKLKIWTGTGWLTVVGPL